MKTNPSRIRYLRSLVAIVILSLVHSAAQAYFVTTTARSSARTNSDYLNDDQTNRSDDDLFGISASASANFNDGNTYRITSASGSANLASGQLTANANSSTNYEPYHYYAYVSSYVTTSFQDELTFTAPEGFTPTRTHNLRVTMAVNINKSDALGNIGGGTSTRAAVLASSYFLGVRQSYEDYVGVPGAENVQSHLIERNIPVFVSDGRIVSPITLTATLRAYAADGGGVLNSHMYSTGLLSMDFSDLPEGFTMTSSSGEFLTQEVAASSAPIPSTFAGLLFLPLLIWRSTRAA